MGVFGTSSERDDFLTSTEHPKHQVSIDDFSPCFAIDAMYNDVYIIYIYNIP